MLSITKSFHICLQHNIATHTCLYTTSSGTLHHLSTDAFRSALLEVPAIADPSILADFSVADIFTTYETTMGDLINKFLPLRPARIRRSALSPWFDMECRTLRRQARRLERLYRRTRLPVDRSTWVHFVRDMHRRYRDKERSYWEAKI